MTDPLSITVGILAILGACSAGAKSLRSIHGSPQEFTRLETELDHLHDVVKCVGELIAEHQLTGNAMVTSLMLARGKLQEIHNFICKTLRHSRRSPIKRRSLVMHKHQLVSFSKDVEIARIHMIDNILLSNL